MSAPALARVTHEAPDTCPGCGCRLDGHAAICPYCGRERATAHSAPKLSVSGHRIPVAPPPPSWIGRAVPAMAALLVGFGLLSLAAVLYGRLAGPPHR